MAGQKPQKTRECVVLDIDTQADFLDVGGACPARNLGTLIPALRKAVAWVKRNHAPVISSLDTHHIDEIPHEGFPPHCCEGTIGQQKLLFTLLAARTCVAADNTLNISTDLFRKYQQVIFRKRTRDLFNNPKADRFLTQVRASEYILLGVGVEYSIKAVALGLIARDRRVTVVTDCCGYWNEDDAEMSFRQMEAKGVTLITVDQLGMRRLRRTVRYPVKSDDSTLMGQILPAALTRRAASGTVIRHR